INSFQPVVCRPLGVLSHSLMCYTCQGETSNKYCMKISMCAKEDNYCVTIKDVGGAGTFWNHPSL
uniref:Snake toxin/toxin-like domain-containing protein n=1 Tax=Terrapene triunguis TaxID=2587831 RepID=A0A674J1V5_9SAUR